ncbi:MAG: N-acetylmuramoyl-L-alanine amidase [Bacillota bacterium]
MKRIFINGGHGGADPGASGNGLVEKDITNFLMVQTKNEILQRTSDVEVKTYQSLEVWSLAKRKIVYEANLFNPDLFVSIHINSGGGTGYEDYVDLDAGAATIEMRKLFHAEVMAWYLSQGVKMHDGGRAGGEMKAADLYVLGGTEAPAILTENLFIDNPSDAALLKNEAFLNGIAAAHARGCLAALGIQPKILPMVNQVEVKGLPVDVPPDHWAAAAVKWAVETGYMKGYEDGTFRGDQGLTRYEEAAVLHWIYGPGRVS